ncbi:hypothetical protein [Rhodanobacter lindaniclasticus]
MKTNAKKTASKKAPATKKVPTMKKTATKKTAPPAPTAKPKGAPGARSNPTYVAKPTDRRMNAESARTKVLAFVSEAGTKGADREAIEKEFAGDESVSVKLVLNYLVSQDMMLKVEKI